MAIISILSSGSSKKTPLSLCSLAALARMFVPPFPPVGGSFRGCVVSAALRPRCSRFARVAVGGRLVPSRARPLASPLKTLRVFRGGGGGAAALVSLRAALRSFLASPLRVCAPPLRRFPVGCWLSGLVVGAGCRVGFRYFYRGGGSFLALLARCASLAAACPSSLRPVRPQAQARYRCALALRPVRPRCGLSVLAQVHPLSAPSVFTFVNVWFTDVYA